MEKDRKIFDTHAHYDDTAFDADRDSLLLSMKENGICSIVNIGASRKSCEKTLELTRQYDFMYGAVGIHPEEAGNCTEEIMDWILEAAKEEKIVAIGEIGLDYHWKEVPKDTQKIWFQKQLQLARKANLPVVIHSRDAAKDTLSILKEEHEKTPLSGIIHCYSNSKETAEEYLDMGFYFGIGGVVTFQNARKLKEAVTYIPLERIVLETDCPYLAPAPHRGERNSSLNLPYVAREIAALKGVSYEEVLEKTYENANCVYRMHPKAQ